MKRNTIAARASKLSEWASYEREFKELRKQSRLTKQRIARALKGKKKSFETRKKMSQARFRYLARVSKEYPQDGRS